MKVLNDYRCPKCRIEQERFSDPNMIVRCTVCDGPMSLIKRAPRFHCEPFSGDFPSATRKWEQKQMARVSQHEKKTQEHGDL